MVTGSKAVVVVVLLPVFYLFTFSFLRHLKHSICTYLLLLYRFTLCPPWIHFALVLFFFASIYYSITAVRAPNTHTLFFSLSIERLLMVPVLLDGYVSANKFTANQARRDWHVNRSINARRHASSTMAALALLCCSALYDCWFGRSVCLWDCFCRHRPVFYLVMPSFPFPGELQPADGVNWNIAPSACFCVSLCTVAPFKLAYYYSIRRLITIQFARGLRCLFFPPTTFLVYFIYLLLRIVLTFLCCCCCFLA